MCHTWSLHPGDTAVNRADPVLTHGADISRGRDSHNLVTSNDRDGELHKQGSESGELEGTAHAKTPV